MVRGYIPVPRPRDIVYAPIDLSVAIAEGLEKRGHRVDFYAPKGSKIKVGVKHLNLRPVVKKQADFQALISEPDLLSHYIPNLWDGFLALEMFEGARRRKYDLLYFAHPEVALPFVRNYAEVPVVYTLHDPIHHWYREIFRMFRTRSQHFISISDNQRKDAPELRYAATIHNGINLRKYKFSSERGKYLLFVGRIVPEKGVKEAIEVAKETDEKLLIIGPTYPDKIEYFNKHIKPHLSRKIRYLGYIDQNELSKYYQGAKALLVPLQWEEPFGLTMIEAMACGTPVVAFKRGAAPEIVVHGENGYLVSSVTGMVRAISRIDKISRQDCRDYARSYFSIDYMVDRYEVVFKNLLTRPRRRKPERFKRIRLPEILDLR